MGATRAIGMAHAVEMGQIGLSVALMDHFTANMYPAVPLAVMPLALDTIEKANAGEWDELVSIPSDLRVSSAKPRYTVRELIDTLRLEAFVKEPA